MTDVDYMYSAKWCISAGEIHSTI